MTEQKKKYCLRDKQLTPITKPIDYKYLMSTLQDYSERYPFIGITYVGTSVLGRGIPMVTLGDSSRRRKSILYVGCHHGMEWITTGILLRFIEEYCNAYEIGRYVCNVSIPRLYQRRCIHIIPQLNVDGADLQINGAGDSVMKERLISMNGGEDFSRWQANARGVDLNHNYDAGFYEYKALEKTLSIEDGCASKYSGVSPESEPEVASLTSFLRYSDDVGMVLTLHSQGEEIYCGDKNVYVPRRRSLASLISRLTGYSLTSPEGTAAYGGLSDWVTRELHRPSFTVECGKGENPLPISDLDGIYGRLREAMFSCPILI